MSCRLGTRWALRALLVTQLTIFVGLISLHFGQLSGGYTDRAAAATELLISAVLVVSMLLSWAPAPWSHRVATAAQSFALLGVCVALVTSALGVRNRNAFELGLNALLVVGLGAGLTVLRRSAHEQLVEQPQP